MRPAPGKGKGRSRIELTRLNTVVFAPIHKVSVRVAVNQRIGSRPSARRARRKVSIISPSRRQSGGKLLPPAHRVFVQYRYQLRRRMRHFCSATQNLFTGPALTVESLVFVQIVAQRGAKIG